MNYFTTTLQLQIESRWRKTNSEYFAADRSTTGFIDETRDTERLRKGISKTGFEWSITPNTFGQTVSYRDNNGSTK
jgi:hypothetical protein